MVRAPGRARGMDNTVRNNSRLAASRARNDEQRSFTVFNRPKLFRIELQHESSQVTSRESNVESELIGKVGVKFPRFQPKKSVPSCGRHPTVRSHSSIRSRAAPIFCRRALPLRAGCELGFRGREAGFREKPPAPPLYPLLCIMVDLQIRSRLS